MAAPGSRGCDHGDRGQVSWEVGLFCGPNRLHEGLGSGRLHWGGLSLVCFPVFSSAGAATWRGQNKRTLRVGIFPSSVAAAEEVASPDGVPRISLPLRSSFVHLSHGDVDPECTWGAPDRMEEYVGGTPGVSHVYAWGGVHLKQVMDLAPERGASPRRPSVVMA